MQLTRFRHFYKTRSLSFETFGKIDRQISNMPMGYTCLLDYDTDTPPGLPDIIGILRIVGVTAKTIMYHRTKRGYHIALVLYEHLKPVELIALQAILGSDQMREALNLMRAVRVHKVSKYWQNRSNILYEHKLR